MAGDKRVRKKIETSGKGRAVHDCESTLLNNLQLRIFETEMEIDC